VWLATDIITTRLEETGEETFHLHWATHGSYVKETLGIEWSAQPIAFFFQPDVFGDVGARGDVAVHRQK